MPDPNQPAPCFERLSPEPGQRLDSIIAYFRAARQPIELFESLKMKSRLELGLPMVADPDSANKSNSAEVERKLEDALLDACRQSGAMLIEEGKIAEGWMYLRPVGDTELAKRLLTNVPITEENYDDMIAVLLHEGVDLKRGYQAVIEQQGTCNSITLYDQSIASRSRADRAVASTCLLNHFYDELLSLVRQDFESRAAEQGVGEDQQASDARELSLGELVTKYPWILGGGGYHLDTTHLSSTVRFATVLTAPDLIQKALDLCQYGRRLAPDFQYPGEEPFKDFYPAHAAFFGASLGQDVEAALRLFEQKARRVDRMTDGTLAIETYIDLLDRIGRPTAALQATMDLFPEEVATQRVMCELLAMSRRALSESAESDPSPGGGGSKGLEVVKQLERFCFDRGDLLTVAALSQVIDDCSRLSKTT